jgi:hypothetical protein
LVASTLLPDESSADAVSAHVPLVKLIVKVIVSPSTVMLPPEDASELLNSITEEPDVAFIL